jgi:hypothetical protein
LAGGGAVAPAAICAVYSPALLDLYYVWFVLCCICYYPRADGAKRRAGEDTNSPRLFTPGETKALAESKVHQISRAWVTNRRWSSSLISDIWRTVMKSGHWLVQFKICIMTTAWRQRNSKHFLIWWLMNFLLAFLQDFVNFKSVLMKKGQKDRLKEGSRR